jgi:hypothetical protein
MAAVVTDGPLDFVAFREHLARWLPPYARPLFVRIMDRIEATDTFKNTKVALAHQGYNPTTTTDAIYFDNPDRRAFVRLDGVHYARIQAGDVRL